MEQIINQVTNELLKALKNLDSLQRESGGNPDDLDDAILSCKKRIDKLRSIRHDLETLYLET